jgi:hypothetical protein
VARWFFVDIRYREGKGPHTRWRWLAHAATAEAACDDAVRAFERAAMAHTALVHEILSVDVTPATLAADA